MRRSGWARLMLGAVLLSLILPLIGAAPVAAQPAEAYALVEAVNAYRELIGLPRLALRGALMVAAQRHVEWMAATFTYSHTGEGGSTPQSRAAAAGFGGSVGENVGGSTNATPGELVFFWDQSYGHRVTMRAAQATHIGCGFAANSDQRLFVLLVGTAPGVAPQAAGAPIAGGTPAIDFTPGPGTVWSANGEMHTGSDYSPVSSASIQSGAGAVAAGPAPTAVAYVMPFDLIRQAEPNADGSIVHVVEAGQTAWAIATRYGVDLQALLALNHLGDSPVLRPGDRLIIRLGEGQAPPPMPSGPSTHTVLAGESLWTIAARYRQAVDDLRVWNDLAAGDVLLPGDVLVIAPPTAVPSATLPPTAAAPLTASPWTLTPSPAPTGSPPPTVIALGSEADFAATLTPDAIAAQRVRRAPETLQRFLVLVALLGMGAILAAGAVIAWVGRHIRRPARTGHDPRDGRPRPQP